MFAAKFGSQIYNEIRESRRRLCDSIWFWTLLPVRTWTVIKTMAKKLIKLQSLQHISKIVGRYGAYDATTVGMKEFLRRIGTTKMRATNRKCEISRELLRTGSHPPQIEFSFEDGTQHTLDCGGLSLNQITQRLKQKVGQIVLLEELKVNPKEQEYTKEVDDYFKELNEAMGFGGVIWEIPTRKGMGSIPIEDVTAEDVEEHDLATLFKADE